MRRINWPWVSIAVAIVALLATPAMSSLLTGPGTASFEVVGEVTYVDLENDLILVSVYEDERQLALVCKDEIVPACGQIQVQDRIVAKGFFGLIGEACEEPMLPYYNALVVGDVSILP